MARSFVALARAFVALALLAAATVAGPALASEPFPEAMRSDLDLVDAPGCALCHQAESAPVGAADKPFSVSAEARGLVAGDLASLKKALDQMRADAVDSDGDGAQDLDELWWGGDPNRADLPVGGKQDPPTYGCSTSPGSPGAAGDQGALGAMLLALLLVRRGAHRARAARPRRPGRATATG